MRICGVAARGRLLATACPVLLALVLGAAAGRAALAQAARVQRVTLPPNHLLRPTGDRNSLAIAPDGSRFAYVANNRLYLKPVGQGEATEISGTAVRQGISNPLFTPDGQAVVFWSAEDAGVLERIPVGGGTPTKICAADNPHGLAWGLGGMLLVGQGPKGILGVPANGGAPETLVRMKDGELAHGPQLLPGGDALVYTLIDAKTADTVGWDHARIVVQPIRGGERKVVIEQGRDARYLANGYLLYALDNHLMAVKFDAKSRAVVGRPATVVDDVHTAANVGTAHFTVSDSGTLLYWPEKSGETQFGLVGLDGTKKILGPAINFANAPRVSPDGKRVAMSGVGDGNLWIADLDNPSGLHKFLKGSYYNFPVFSEDGKSIVFGTNLPNGVETVYAMPSSLSGEIEVLARPARAPESWKQGTQTFSYVTRRGVMDYDLWTFDLATRTFAPLVNIPVSAQLSSRFSPRRKVGRLHVERDGRLRGVGRALSGDHPALPGQPTGRPRAVLVARRQRTLLRFEREDVRGEVPGRYTAVRTTARAADLGLRPHRVATHLRPAARRQDVCHAVPRPVNRRDNPQLDDGVAVKIARAGRMPARATVRRSGAQFTAKQYSRPPPPTWTKFIWAQPFVECDEFHEGTMLPLSAWPTRAEGTPGACNGPGAPRPTTAGAAGGAHQPRRRAGSGASAARGRWSTCDAARPVVARVIPRVVGIRAAFDCRPGQHVVFAAREGVRHWVAFFIERVRDADEIADARLLERVAVQLGDIRSDELALLVVPRAVANAVTSIDGIRPLRAQIGVPRHVTAAGGRRECLALRVRAGQSSKVAATPDTGTRDEEGHRLLGTAASPSRCGWRRSTGTSGRLLAGRRRSLSKEDCSTHGDTHRTGDESDSQRSH